ncbi:MAG: hypothetical protein H7Y86_04180 [Rhizobacter sp.]|nr:hypothetical protein [Ferruginibacter sp.]
MNKIKFLIICIACAPAVLGQNIGIGTATPISRLSIQGSESTGNGLATGIQLTNTAPGGGSWYLRSGATGTATPAGGFSIGNNADYILSLNSNGYMGLLTVNPLERLHLAEGNLRLDFSDKGIILNGFDRPFVTRAFDTFTSGLYNGLGRWGMFMEPSRLTLGIPNMPGKGFEVARYELNGVRSSLFGVDVNGAVQLNGNTGSAGQVFTSNGAGAASWQKAASSSDNNVRFEASFISNFTSPINPVLEYTSEYNFNTSAVTINATGITINLSGLYHIEGYYDVEYTFNSAPGYFTQEFYSDLDRVFSESRREPLLRDVAFVGFRYLNYGRFSREVYITAPASIRCGFGNSYNLGGASYLNSLHLGRVSGYLISQ